MKIQVTNVFKKKLKEIYLYHKQEVSVSVAIRIKQGIFTKIELLKKFPDLGPVDLHLESFRLNHRKLTEGNYKIVYRVTQNTIYITDLFDTQQDPKKQEPNL